MSLYILDKKIAMCSTPITNPGKIVEYQRSLGNIPKTPICNKVIIIYQRRLFQYILDNFVDTCGYGYLENFCTIKPPFNNVGVMKLPAGAAYAAIKFEEMISLGAKEFVSIGTAGTIQEHISIGDVIFAESALRDEGVSNHYLPQSDFITANDSFNKNYLEFLQRHYKTQVGPTWTTQAIYRETEAEVSCYQKQGVLCVEMEAATLMSIAKFRKVSFAPVFVVSDSLAKKDWEPHFRSPVVQEKLISVFSNTLDFLRINLENG